MIIKASVLNPEQSFTMGGLEYLKGTYVPFYDNKAVNEQGEVDKSSIRIGIRSNSDSNNILQEPIPVSSWSNGTTNYSDFDALLTDISGLLFNLAGETAALQTGKYLIGWQDYADSNTSEVSPIVQSSVNGGEVQLTNNNNDTATDGNTNINSATTLVGVNDLWDTTTNTFIFKGTGIGKNDLFDIRFNPNVSPNIVSQDFGIRMDFYDDVAGTGNKVFSLKKSGKTRNDSAGAFDDDFIHIRGYFGESILNGSAVAYFYGSKSFELEYIGHMITIFKISR